MFYKHYNGGEYLVLGFVHQEELDSTKTLKVFLATDEATLEAVNVYMYDGEFHADVTEEMVLYMAQDGQLWLRNSIDFYGNVEVDGEVKRRFKLLQ
jgi:hypothetical protein